MTYTEAITKLEAIVAKMQSPDCDIDLLAGYTEEALQLMKTCRDKLRKTEEDVKKCLETLSETAEP